LEQPRKISMTTSQTSRSEKTVKTISAHKIEQLPAVRVTDKQYEALWREDMKGCIKSISVDFSDHTAIVTTANGCVDMRGCISTIMMLDPAVENIQTIDGGAFTDEHCSKDTQYLKHPEHGWFAIRWDRSVPSRGDFYGTALRATKKLRMRT
jgi:hypothetical protein